MSCPAVLAQLVPVCALFVLGACKTTIVEVAEQPGASVAADPLDHAEQQEAVREAVRRYADALEARDPAAAAAAVVPETFGFYEDLRIAALRASREQLESWGLMSVMIILQIRLRSSRAELEQLDGHRLFSDAIAAGMGFEAINLDEIWIDDTGTRAEVRSDGEALLWLRSVTDADGRAQWRLDVPAMFVELEPRFEAVAREQIDVEGQVRMAYALLELTDAAPYGGVIDLAILDGPLETIDKPAPASQP